MDTTSFVFGPKPAEKASSRWCKNISLLWKMAGAVSISLILCLLVLWLSSLATFTGISEHLSNDMQIHCQRNSDVMLSVLRGLIERRTENIDKGVESICDSWKRSSSSVPSLDSLEEKYSFLSDEITFLFILDDEQRLLYFGKSFGDDQDPIVKQLSETKKVSFFSEGRFRELWNSGAKKGVLAPNSQLLRELSESGVNDTTNRAEKLALVSLQPCHSGGTKLLFFGGLLLSSASRLLQEVQETFYDIRRMDEEHSGEDEASASIFSGKICIASSASSGSEGYTKGSKLVLPENLRRQSSSAVWRGKTKIFDKEWVSSVVPITDIYGKQVGYLSSSSDLERFRQPYDQAMSSLLEEYRLNMGVALVLALVFSMIIGFFAARIIIGPLAMLTELTAKVADGKLNVDVTLDGEDEIGMLASSFRNMVSNLRALTKRIEDATVQLGSSASQLKDNLASQSSASQQQAAAVKGTTDTLEQLTASSRKIADSSLAVVRAAAKTLESAQRGKDSSKATIEQMALIQESNDEDLQSIASLSERVSRIEEVMTLINTVADQTKLIAFNAAIEAAAAGEAGKRFSVVAEEIRRLAENVLDQASLIRNSISDVQEAAKSLVNSRREGRAIVEKGVEITERTSNDLSEILEDTQSVLSDSKQISLSTQEQRLSTEQSLKAIKEIKKGDAVLADGTKHTKEVVDRLFGLSRDLKDSVERFELDD